MCSFILSDNSWLNCVCAVTHALRTGSSASQGKHGRLLGNGLTFLHTSPKHHLKSASGWSASLLCKHHLCDVGVEPKMNAYEQTIIYRCFRYDTPHPGAAVFNKSEGTTRKLQEVYCTCCHQNAALSVHDPFTQRLRGETCKLSTQWKEES